MESWHPAVERGPSLVFKSDGLVDEASDGFLDLVTARPWNGSSQKILLISDEVISLLDAQTSRASHVWPLRDVTSAEVGVEGDVVCLTLASGLWWARRPSLVLPSHERASLLCQQLAKRCAQRWRLHADGGGQPRRPSIPSESEAAASAPEAAGGELSSAWREQISEELARERQASASVEELSRGRAASDMRAEAAEAAATVEAAAAALARSEAAEARRAEADARAMVAEAEARAAQAEAEVTAMETDAEEVAATAAASAASAAVVAAERDAEVAVEQARAYAATEAEVRREAEAGRAAAEESRAEAVAEVSLLRALLEQRDAEATAARAEAEAAKAEALAAKAAAGDGVAPAGHVSVPRAGSPSACESLGTAQAEALSVQRAEALELMGVLASQIDDMAKLQAQLLGQRPLELSALAEATAEALAANAEVVEDSAEARGEARPDLAARGSPRLAIYSDGGEAVGVYRGFEEWSPHVTEIEEGDAADSSRPTTDSGTEEGANQVVAIAPLRRVQSAPPQPNGSLEAHGALAEAAGEEEESEEEGEEEEAMEEARGAMAAALSEQLVQRMTAVSESQKRLEQILRQDEYGGGDGWPSRTDATPPVLGRAPSLNSARARLRYSTAGIAVGAYEGFSTSSAREPVSRAASQDLPSRDSPV